MNKSAPIILLIASIGFILVGIAFSVLIDRRPTSNQRDLRARASTEGTLDFVGILTSYDANTNIMVVDKLKFTENSEAVKDMGTWNITAPQQFRFESFTPGSMVHIKGVSSSFQVSTHTLTATSVSK